MIVGLTRYVNQNHLCRAALESVAYQSAEVVEAMAADASERLTELKVDGGMVVNETLMQFQADVLGVDVVRPKVIETTALGAAYAAGLAVGFWDSTARWRPTGPKTPGGLRRSMMPNASASCACGAGRWRSPSAGWTMM